MNRTQVNAKTFFRFAAPSVMSMVMFSLYTMVDGIFVSRAIDEFALAAVNLSMPYINAIFAVSIFLSVGTSTVAAIHLGRGEKEDADRVFTQNVFVLAGIALIITLLVQLFTEPIARFLGGTQNNLAYMVEYLRAVSPFTVCFIVGYGLEVLVKTGGHPEVSLIGMLSCFGVNILLHYILVVRLGLGMGGAGIATGIAQLVAMCIFFAHFLSGGSNIRLVNIKKPFLGIYKRILPLGLSDFGGEISLALVIFLFNRVAFSVAGDRGVVCYAVISYVNNLVLMIMAGISQGMQPLVSLSLGAGDIPGTRRFFSYALRTVVAAAALSFAACMLFPEGITALLLERDSASFAYTANALRLFAPSFLMVGVNLVSAGFFTAMERPARALTISLGRGIALMCASLFIMSALLGDTGVWLAPTVSEALCLAVTLVFLRSYFAAGRRNNAPT